jgi:hypothetical protein
MTDAAAKPQGGFSMKKSTLLILVAALFAASCSSTGTAATGPAFTSIAELGTWLSAQPANTAVKPYAVALNVSDLGDRNGTDSIRYVLTDDKYVSLDLSGSTFTSIKYEAFSGRTGLTSITIPNSVISIEKRAFYDCESLTSVTFVGDFQRGATSITFK